MDQASAIDKVKPLVRAVSRRVSRDWDGIGDPEDVESEIWLELLAESSESYVVTLAELPDANRQAAVNQIGRHVAERMREDYYTFSGNYTYDVDEVRTLLERGILDQDGFSTTFMRSEAVDVQVGMERLLERNSDYWASIVNYYKLGERFSSTDSASKMRLMRAREGLTREMNGSRRAAEVEYGGR